MKYLLNDDPVSGTTEDNGTKTEDNGFWHEEAQSPYSNCDNEYCDYRVHRELFKLRGSGFDPAWCKGVRECFLEEMTHELLEIWVNRVVGEQVGDKKRVFQAEFSQWAQRDEISQGIKIFSVVTKVKWGVPGRNAKCLGRDLFMEDFFYSKERELNLIL